MELDQELAAVGSLALREYIAVHDQIFATSLWRSLRRVLPIPGLFERIPYAAHSRTLVKVRASCADLRVKAGSALVTALPLSARAQYLESFADYIEALSQTVSKLLEICDDLADSANGHSSDSLSQYWRNCEEYDRLRAMYAALGHRLNAAYGLASREA